MCYFADQVYYVTSVNALETCLISCDIAARMFLLSCMECTRLPCVPSRNSEACSVNAGLLTELVASFYLELLLHLPLFTVLKRASNSMMVRCVCFQHLINWCGSELVRLVTYHLALWLETALLSDDNFQPHCEYVCCSTSCWEQLTQKFCLRMFNLL